MKALRRCPPIALCLALASAARPGLAESPEVATNSESETVYARGEDPLVATPVQQEQSQARFSRGKELFDAGEYGPALDEFSASFAIVASPNARLYRARCLLRLGRTVEAYAEYGRTMVQALELGKQEARYQRTAEAATQERKELETQLAFVRANVHRPRAETRLFVNGEEIRRTAWGEPIPVVAGTVKLELVTPDFPKQERTLELAAGVDEELILDVGEPLAPKAAPRPQVAEESAPRQAAASDEPTSLMPYVVVSGAIGVVGIGAFAVLGTMSRENFERLEANCADGACPASEGQVLEAGRRQQTWANVGLAVGAVGLATAVTLWVIDGSGERESGSVALGLTPHGLELRGRL